MKTAMLTIEGDLSNTGWTPAAAALAAAESIIDSHRFANETDRVLARHEGDEGLALFPSTDELMAMGVSLYDLSGALEAGLKGEDVAGLLASYDADTLNGHLANYVEHAELASLHPDPVERVLHRHGECACA
ncbi:MAG: hypothetical protein AB7W16_12135 [Candidatus Obscuribacterales bacterium]